MVFEESFPTADGRGRFVPAGLKWADERPDQDYPFVLITGRQLEHWHTGAMTRRATVLNAIEPDAVVYSHPDDLNALGMKDGDLVKISSRRGEIIAPCRSDNGLQPKSIFHSVLLPRGGSQSTDQCGPGSGWKNSGSKVLRG